MNSIINWQVKLKKNQNTSLDYSSHLPQTEGSIEGIKNAPSKQNLKATYFCLKVSVLGRIF